MAERNARIDREVARLKRVLAQWRATERTAAQRPAAEVGERAIQDRLRELSRQRAA